MNNKPKVDKCACCATAKPVEATTAKPPSSASIFGKQSSIAKPMANSDTESSSIKLPVTNSGFGDKFKLAAGSWECDTCMVKNKAETAKCAGCKTPKPWAGHFPVNSIKAAATAAAPKFGHWFDDLKFNLPLANLKPAAGNWTCDTCMLKNKGNVSKCMACETPKPSSQQTLSAPPAQVYKFGPSSAGSESNSSQSSKTTLGLPPTSGFKFGGQSIASTVQKSTFNFGGPKTDLGVNQTSTTNSSAAASKPPLPIYYQEPKAKSTEQSASPFTNFQFGTSSNSAVAPKQPPFFNFGGLTAKPAENKVRQQTYSIGTDSYSKMAASKYAETEQFTYDDLITCGICHTEIQQPKSLPCFHTYCLGCIREWSKTRTDGHIVCPLCRETTPLPPDGVNGLRNNFFVTKLKDGKALNRQLMGKDVKIICTSCDVSDRNEAVARCIECDEFLCESCFKGHKSFRLTKSHSVFTLVDIRSGKVDLPKKIKEDHCQDHPGQVLWFYCATCSVPICRDCTVVKHPTGSHTLITLTDVSSGQREEINALVAACMTVQQDVEGALKSTHTMHEELDIVCKRASESIDEAKEKIKKAFLSNLEQQTENLKRKIEMEKLSRNKILQGHTDDLQMLKSRLTTALETGRQLSKEGSDCDIASTYLPLTSTLKQLKQVNTPYIANIGAITFVANSSYMASMGSIGSIEVGEIERGAQRKSRVKLNKKHWNAPWKMVKRIGNSGKGKLWDAEGVAIERKLVSARGVAINKDGNVAVADTNAKGIHVYGIDDGELKLSIDTTKKSLHSNSTQCKSYPRDVAVAHDGNYILSDCTQSLTIYDNKGNYVRQIPITTGAKTLGISINSQNHILVGDYSNHLSVYNYSDGSFISCVDTPIYPWYVSASSHDDRIIISTCGGFGDYSVHVIDAKGQTIHTLCPPTDVTASWYPWGVYTIGEGEEEEVYICNAYGSPGVYRFSLSTGKYIGCVTTELSHPLGIVFTDDGKLVVTQLDAGVKIFMSNNQ